MLWLPPLRRGAGALTLAAAFLACRADRALTPSTGPTASPAIRFDPSAAPAWAGDFADPFVLVAGSAYYAFATNVGPANVPVLRSGDLEHWTAAGDALPVLPSWAESGRKLTWAPAVARVGPSYLLFFTARDRRSGRQCIGRAASADPAGPFRDTATAPFLCQAELGGSIDPSLVQDDEESGGWYLLWKNDGNCCDLPVRLWSQRLDPTGRALVGPRAALLDRDRSWEGPLVEGPTMWRERGAWHLLYSANLWNSERYAIGYARCESPLGPCRKRGSGPVMQSDDETAGPGGPEVFADGEGRRWMAYHGWRAGAVGYRQGGARSLWLARVEMAGP
jgi:beta-xylosidase